MNLRTSGRSSFVNTLLAILTWLHISYTEGAYLNKYIHDYQPLRFDHSHLHERHSRVKRDIDQEIRWNFKAYGRTFKLHLKPDRSVFAENHVLDFGGEIKPTDTRMFYEGSLSDTPGSLVHMAIHSGHVSGQVSIPGHTTYFIEPARHHFTNHTDVDFHTIIYPESSMDLDPFRHERKQGSCGGEFYSKGIKVKKFPGNPKKQPLYEDNPYAKYSAALNQDNRAAHRRHRRAAGELQGASAKACFMQLRADQLLWRHYLAKYNNDEEQTKEAILALFARHVRELTNIFTATTFDDPSNPSAKFQGINFVLQRSKIIKDCTSADTNNNYCTDELDVTLFLHLTSNEDHDEFCLVHTFTYRDFQDGTLGLAWVAEPESPNSGVCGRYGKVATESGIRDQSLNTGIVSFINYNTEVPPRVSQITFAHEVGHNFGSPHDMTDECAPYGTTLPGASDGNFIMYPKATSGNLPHNKEFSQCSRTSIFKVLQAVGGIRFNCFKESDTAFCGNNIVEEGEQCDCGYAEDCTDTCCNGRAGNPATDCKRKAGKPCSPSEGFCCSSECQYKGSNVVCQPESGCQQQSLCTGGQAACPSSTNKENFTTFCNDFQGVCELGECSASLCKNMAGWEECFKTSADGAPEAELCYLSCKSPSGVCVSSLDETAVAIHDEFKKLLESVKSGRNVTSAGVQRPAGSPCNNFVGYCDVFSKCRQVDSEGPFRKLTDMIFDPVTFSNIREWAEDHWWAVLLMAVGVIVFMGVFVKVFSYNTPSKDPRKKRRGRAANQDQRQPGRNARGAQGGGAAPRRGDKRAAVYTTDMAMQERQPYSGASAPQSGAGYPPSGGGYFDNYGYNNKGEYHPPPPAYQPPAPPRGSQFDRIQGHRY